MKQPIAFFSRVRRRLRPAHCILLYLTVFSGCGSKVEQFPKPQNGFDTKRIEYPKPPPLTTPVTPRASDAVIIDVPKADYSKQPATPPTIASTIPATPSQIVCFEGELFIPPPVTANAMIIVECFQLRTMKTRNRDSGEPEDRVSHAMAATGWGMSRDLGKGRLDYRVQFAAPKFKGQFQVEVKVIHAPTSRVQKVIATGILDVR